MIQSHIFYLGRDGTYIYTEDLLELEHACSIDLRLAVIHTPLNLASWNKRLQQHPGKDFSSYILWGTENGVNPAALLKLATTNMQSALQHLEVIFKKRSCKDR